MDALLYLPVYIIFIIFPGRTSANANFWIWVISAATPVAACQFYFLSKYGQSLGKRWKRIKIVELPEEKNGGFYVNVFKRIFVFEFLAMAPLIGFFFVEYEHYLLLVARGLAELFRLVDLLAIFGSERRCLHDYVANTIVVKEQEPRRRKAVKS